MYNIFAGNFQIMYGLGRYRSGLRLQLSNINHDLYRPDNEKKIDGIAEFYCIRILNLVFVHIQPSFD